MDQTAGIAEREVLIDGQRARVFLGGRGEPLLLVHGGWGGARLHWSPVWNQLATRFQVIAPDLPGIGRTDQPGLGSVERYAGWLTRLLDTLKVRSAWLVGNSFGASVVCRLATTSPGHCRGLVLVNGFPMPPTPRLLRWLGTRKLGHRLVRAAERRVAYSPAVLDKGFANLDHVPEDLRQTVQQSAPPQLDALVDALVAGGEKTSHRFAPLLLWGEQDHLPGTSARSAQKLRQSWPGARLTFIDHAGHLPQLENPPAFVAALTSFVDKHLGHHPLERPFQSAPSHTGAH